MPTNTMKSSPFRRRVGIRNISDYSPFGVLLAERTVETANFRRGFQGQEHDDEVKGVGNSVNFSFRMHDPRVGRFFVIDPLHFNFPYNSCYAFSENKVINAIELEGLETVEAYEAWIKDNGDYHSRLVSTYTINGLLVDIRKKVFYDMNTDGTKNIIYIRYSFILPGGESGSSITFTSYDDINYNEFLNFFNPEPEPEPVPVLGPSNEKSFHENKMDEAYDEGDPLKYIYHQAQDIENKSSGIAGAKNWSKNFRSTGELVKKVPGIGTIAGTFYTTLADYMDSAIEFKEGDPNAGANSTKRATELATTIIENSANDDKKIIKNTKKILDETKKMSETIKDK